MLIRFAFLIPCVCAIASYEPIISFIDGNGKDNMCKPKMERHVSGLSGIVFSHGDYGSAPYSVSKNCILLLTVPIGYRIRIRVLEFEIRGITNSCAEDTLYLLDHEQAIDSPTINYGKEAVTPGPLIGQHCGKLNTSQVLAESSQNAMTLWWHSGQFNGTGQPPPGGRGFRVHWNAFRVAKTKVPCAPGREFACDDTTECIPAELACNRHADCADRSDILLRRQQASQCENVVMDPLATVSGVQLLLMAAVLFLCFGLFCLCMCACYRWIRGVITGNSHDAVKPAVTHQNAVETQGLRPRPESGAPYPPSFMPPSPPKMPPPGVDNYSPRHYPRGYANDVHPTGGYPRNGRLPQPNNYRNAAPVAPRHATHHHASRPRSNGGEYAFVKDTVNVI